MSKRCERLKLNAVGLCRRGGPGGLSGSTNKVAGRFVNKNLESWELAGDARAGNTCGQRRPARLKEAYQVCDLALFNTCRIVDAEVFAGEHTTDCRWTESGIGSYAFDFEIVGIIPKQIGKRSWLGDRFCRSHEARG